MYRNADFIPYVLMCSMGMRQAGSNTNKTNNHAVGFFGSYRVSFVCLNANLHA